MSSFIVVCGPARRADAAQQPGDRCRHARSLLPSHNRLRHSGNEPGAFANVHVAAKEAWFFGAQRESLREFGVKRFCEPAATNPTASDPIERDRIGIWI